MLENHLSATFPARKLSSWEKRNPTSDTRPPHLFFLLRFSIPKKKKKEPEKKSMKIIYWQMIFCCVFFFVSFTKRSRNFYVIAELKERRKAVFRILKFLLILSPRTRKQPKRKNQRYMCKSILKQRGQ